jgi:hypothetical protein
MPVAVIVVAEAKSKCTLNSAFRTLLGVESCVGVAPLGSPKLCFQETWPVPMSSTPTRYCKTKYGYGAFVDVTKPASGMEDKQESYFLAETLKYAVLTVPCLLTLMEVPSAFLSDGPLRVSPPLLVCSLSCTGTSTYCFPRTTPLPWTSMCSTRRPTPCASLTCRPVDL